jgi:hypothetical protein
MENSSWARVTFLGVGTARAAGLPPPSANDIVRVYAGSTVDAPLVATFAGRFAAAAVPATDLRRIFPMLYNITISQCYTFESIMLYYYD